MCLGTVISRVKPKIGYKFFISNYPCLTGVFYGGEYRVGKWYLPSNFGTTLSIPTFVKPKDFSQVNADLMEATDNPVSKYEDYLSGFHMLPSLKEAKRYKKFISGSTYFTLYKCEYVGVLATGYDYSSVDTLKNRVKCIIVTAMKPLEKVSLE